MTQIVQRMRAARSLSDSNHRSAADGAPATDASAWRKGLAALGFVLPTCPPGGALTAGQGLGFQWLRWVFGCIWLYDTWTVSSSATRHAMAMFLGLPFGSPWVHLAGTGILLLSLFVALALLSAKGMRAALWIGLAYLLVLWLVVEHGGDFDPAAGGTDLGTAPPYMLLLVFVWATWQADPAHAPQRNTAAGVSWAYATRVVFGFIWAWDALYKLRPYFLTHFTSYLEGAAATPGQPAWVLAWLHGWISLIGATSPLLFAIVAAAIEVTLACSLLSGRALRFTLPLGAVFSLLIWTTAEGFGGPYGMGTTGMAGNLFGTAIIYALLFIGLMVFYRWPRRLAPR